MKKWKLPRVFEIESAGQYFVAMADLNASSRSFSHRELAKYLKWPMSYIPDLIKGRKTFTTARAIELIQAFKINPLDAEHLIYLSVASQSKKEVSEINDLRRIKSPRMRENIFPELTVFDFDSWLTCQAVSLMGPQATFGKIEKLLSTRGFKADKVRTCLKILLDAELIKKDRRGYSCVVEKGYSDINFQSEQMLALQKSFIASTLDFLKDVHRPATGTSAFVVINKDRYHEVREKILSLKHWILEVSAQDSKDTQDKTILFQFDIHLHPVFRQELLAELVRAESN